MKSTKIRWNGIWEAQILLSALLLIKWYDFEQVWASLYPLINWKLGVANSKVANAAQTVSTWRRLSGDWQSEESSPVPREQEIHVGWQTLCVPTYRFFFFFWENIRMSVKYWQLIKSLKTFCLIYGIVKSSAGQG